MHGSKLRNISCVIKPQFLTTAALTGYSPKCRPLSPSLAGSSSPCSGSTSNTCSLCTCVITPAASSGMAVGSCQVGGCLLQTLSHALLIFNFYILCNNLEHRK